MKLLSRRAIDLAMQKMIRNAWARPVVWQYEIAMRPDGHVDFAFGQAWVNDAEAEFRAESGVER